MAALPLPEESGATTKMASPSSIAKHHRITQLLAAKESSGGDHSSSERPGIILRSETFDQEQHLSVEQQSSAASTSSTEDDLPYIVERHEENVRPAPLLHLMEDIRNKFSVDIDAQNLIDVHPDTIDLELLVTFNTRDGDPSIHEFQGFEWYKANSFVRIKETCDKSIEKYKENFKDQTQGRSIYLRYGYCSVVGSRDESRYDPNTSRFDEENLREKAIFQIYQFILSYPGQRFKLRIFCDYGFIYTQPVAGQRFCHTMQKQYYEKLKIPVCNIRNQEYISLSDLSPLTSEEITNALIDDDDDYGKDDTAQKAKKAALRALVSNTVSQTLLAVCVYKSIPLSYLEHFIRDHRYTDSSFREIRKPCENDSWYLCNVHHRNLAEGMPVFFARKVERDQWFHENVEEEIFPISFAGKRLGKGYSSYVHEVCIDIMHRDGNALASEASRTYALKIFNSDQSSKSEESRAAFRKEMLMLLHLAIYPHPHILTHITSWEQQGIFYILYEKANANLYEHMRDKHGGNLEAERVLWFLRQLYGLADAIRKVHQLREPPKTTPRLFEKQKRSILRSMNPKSSADDDEGREKSKRNPKNRKKGIVGFHHDIKPENILTFGQRDELPMLKLSDFGAGKFSIVRDKQLSGKHTSKLHGTVTYFGPEKDVKLRGGTKVKVSRPFDMWALGCVFLEFLLWFLGHKDPVAGKSFDSLRLSSSKGEAELDYFWQRKEPHEIKYEHSLNVPEKIDDYKVNVAVSRVLDMLELVWCRKMPALFKVVREIRALLVIRPKDRLKAVNLANHMDSILSQARADLIKTPDLYKKHWEDVKTWELDIETYDANCWQSRYSPINGDADNASDVATQYAEPQSDSADISTVTSQCSSRSLLRDDQSDDERSRRASSPTAPSNIIPQIGTSFPGEEVSVTQDIQLSEEDADSEHNGQHGLRKLRRTRSAPQRRKTARTYLVTDKIRPWNPLGHPTVSESPLPATATRDTNTSSHKRTDDDGQRNIQEPTNNHFNQPMQASTSPLQEVSSGKGQKGQSHGEGEMAQGKPSSFQWFQSYWL